MSMTTSGAGRLHSTNASKDTGGDSGQQSCSSRLGDRPQVVERVQVAGHRQQPHRSTACVQPSELGEPSVSAAHRNAVEQLMCTGCAVGTQADHPVATSLARPMLSMPRRAAAMASASEAATCGVSIPMITPGPRSKNPLHNRSSKPLPRWATTSKAVGIQFWESPSSSSTRRAPVRLATWSTAVRVSARAAAATSAACSGVHGGDSRVLTWPATGALAMTETSLLSCFRCRATDHPCRARRRWCPSRCR